MEVKTKTIQLTKEDIHKGNLILVNKDYPLEENSIVTLEPFNEEYQNMLFSKEANVLLQFVLKEIKATNKIVPVSAFRTKQEQIQIFEDSLKENGEEFTYQYVALPNSSEHQTGLAIDLGLNLEEIDFIRPAFPHSGICDEFRKVALKYGFIERYTKEKETITGISAEEWHFRYVGYPHSEIMNHYHFCLEEYIEFLKQYQENPFIYQEYEIYYIPFEEKEIELNNGQISGNNVDGFIVTKK